LLRAAKPADEGGLQSVCNLLGRGALKKYVQDRFRLLTERAEYCWLRSSHYWEAFGIDTPKKTAELRSTVDGVNAVPSSGEIDVLRHILIVKCSRGQVELGV
jgi:hypothetical protein